MRRLVLAVSLVICGSLQAGGASDAVLADSPPRWEMLEYRRRAFWVQAESRIHMAPCDQQQQSLWCLTAESGVADNRETLRITARPDGSMLERHRESVGVEDRRIKRWLYNGNTVTRLRLEPNAPGPAADYVLTSEQTLRLPPTAGEVTDALFLLALAAPGASGSPGVRSATVQTDMNFYRVDLTAAGSARRSISFVLDGRALSGSRDVHLVEIAARPLEPLADPPDFSLLGLSGKITIAYDQATGMPVQLRGRAPHLGETEINLRTARTRQTAQ